MNMGPVVDFNWILRTQSAAEKSPHQIHYLLQFYVVLAKKYSAQLLITFFINETYEMDEI